MKTKLDIFWMISIATSNQSWCFVYFGSKCDVEQICTFDYRQETPSCDSVSYELSPMEKIPVQKKSISISHVSVFNSFSSNLCILKIILESGFRPEPQRVEPVSCTWKKFSYYFCRESSIYHFFKFNSLDQGHTVILNWSDYH